MTITMHHGYSQPPSSGGAAYHGLVPDYAFPGPGPGLGELSSQFGYTYVTQEGEGWSEPHDEAFHPTQHWDGFPALVGHPNTGWTRPRGLMVPGALGVLGNCCASCAGKPMNEVCGGDGCEDSHIYDNDEGDYGAYGRRPGRPWGSYGFRRMGGFGDAEGNGLLLAGLAAIGALVVLRGLKKRRKRSRR